MDESLFDNKMQETLDSTIRLIETIAFVIHGLLGLLEPLTGCLRGAFNEKINTGMPKWFWPVAGLILWSIAFTNVQSTNNLVILSVQAQIAAFHSGAVFQHRILGHHPLVGIAPGFFVVLASLVLWLRNSWLVAAAMVVACVMVAYCLAQILVTPPREEEGDIQHLTVQSRNW